MKILLLAAHPDLARSRINRLWFESLSALPNVTARDLAQVGGPQMRFRREQEHDLLLAHDRIVMQFPFHWYAAPAVLKAWIDEVYSDGFAYGQGGDKLKGKELLLATSTGGPADSYHAGNFNNFSMDELLKPYQQTALLTGMTYLRPFVFHGMALASDDEINASVPRLLAHVTDEALDPRVRLALINRQRAERKTVGLAA
ncbi:NADPH oxidoreductase [Frateuria sp. Soil773]|uniref:NAD(P)H-dependent oxidoreductase n=1 Tax=Frateuria sp. Soil773 TaxID=1736407 RepID=UPI0006F346C5|nr:NAD(P)H-dependent oxidoreductase [Frateuria sp. Soil773]KRE89161.1 NADPH oxidoreductase [Frateuria sp. Soil773]